MTMDNGMDADADTNTSVGVGADIGVDMDIKKVLLEFEYTALNNAIRADHGAFKHDTFMRHFMSMLTETLTQTIACSNISSDQFTKIKDRIITKHS